MKRIFSLLILFTFYWTLTVQAVGSEAMLRAGTTLYADPEESSILLVTDEPKRVDIQDVTETHTSVTIDTQNGFVRNDDVRYAVTRYTQTETDATMRPQSTPSVPVFRPVPSPGHQRFGRCS